MRFGSRRGNAAMVGLSLSMLMGFGALVVDLGIQRVTNAQLQAAVEAGALGGASYLDRTPLGMIAARDRAVSIANGNVVNGAFQVGPEHVELGEWDGSQFTSLGTLTNEQIMALPPQGAEIRNTNAIRVQATYSGIATALAGAVWGATISTTNSALAIREPQSGVARSVPCMLPLAIPDCSYLNGAGEVEMPTTNPPPIKFVMSNANIDNVGWGNPFSGGYGSTDIINMLRTGGCQPGGVEIGDPIFAKNGQNTTVLDEIGTMLDGNASSSYVPGDFDTTNADIPERDGKEANCPKGHYLSASLDTCVDPNGKPHIGSLVSSPPGNGNKDKWPKSIAGTPTPKVIQGPVALVSPADCANPSFTGSLPVSAFAWAMIFDVQSKAAKADGTELEAPNIWVQLDFITERDFGGDTEEGLEGPIQGFAKPKLVF